MHIVQRSVVSITIVQLKKRFTRAGVHKKNMYA